MYPSRPSTADLCCQFLLRHPLDSVGQWLAEAHGAARYVPESDTRPRLATSEQDSVRRYNDDLHGEPRHLRVDRLVLGLR